MKIAGNVLRFSSTSTIKYPIWKPKHQFATVETNVPIGAQCTAIIHRTIYRGTADTYEYIHYISFAISTASPNILNEELWFCTFTMHTARAHTNGDTQKSIPHELSKSHSQNTTHKTHTFEQPQYWDCFFFCVWLFVSELYNVLVHTRIFIGMHQFEAFVLR